MTDAGEIWRTLALNEIQRCDQIANIVGRLARDLVKSAGGDEGDAASYRAKEEFYHRLDLPFRKWLSVLDPGQTVEERNHLQSQWPVSYTHLDVYKRQDILSAPRVEMTHFQTLRRQFLLQTLINLGSFTLGTYKCRTSIFLLNLPTS